MKALSWTTLLVGGLLAAGCSQRDAQRARQDINSSLKANKTAVNIDEWELSQYNPEVLFKQWREESLDPSAVCEELQKKTPQELTLFEEEIKSKDNQDMLEPCREELNQKLEAYWASERAKTTSAPTTTLSGSADFKFPDNVQYRDLSHGYFGFKGDVANKEVILTFDDGPHPKYTDSILTTLNKVNAKAIFFTLGQNTRAYPDVIRREAAGGNGVGSHSIDHKCVGRNSRCASHNARTYKNGHMLSYDEAIAEIVGGHQAVYDVLGWVSPFFRFPYGEDSPDLKKFLFDHSMGEFAWTIDSNDWREGSSPQQVIDDTISQIEKMGRGIVLFHDVQRKTTELLPGFLRELYFKGYSVVLLKPSDPNAIYNNKIVKLHNPSTRLK